MQSPEERSHAFRLLPEQDLKDGIQQYVVENNIKAGWLVTCVGSLTRYSIRFANQQKGSEGCGYFEIVNLSGLISADGSHMHIIIADCVGKTLGGHLLAGCRVYTTAEIIIAESRSFIFTREKDGTTPWKELQIKNDVNK